MSSQLPELPHAPVPPRVAVVGCGYWGRNLVRNFAALGALAAVHDADPAAAAAASESSGVPIRDWADILADSEVHGIVVAAPAAQHAALASQALQAGKHVFVEKPLALELDDAAALRREAESSGLVLMVGHLLQYHPAFERLQALVRQGNLGRLQYLYSNRLNLGKIRREENILWSFAPHDVSMILSLVGEEPDEISAEGSAYLHKTIADVTLTHLSFPSGPRAHVFVSWLHPFKEQKLVVVGELGMAVFDDSEAWDGKLRVFEHHIDWRDGHPEPVRHEGYPIALEPDEPLARECRHFLECMRTGARPRTDAAEGERVLRVLTRAQEAMERGRGAAAPAPQAAGIQVHPSAYIDEDVEIGAGTRVWHFTHVLPGSRIGRNCTVGQNVVIGPDVRVGDGCKIQNNVSLYAGVELEEGVFCGPSCVFTNVRTPRAEVNRRGEFDATLVRRGATIGANATIVCGTTIGTYALVGAGAVVTRDVADHALVVGNPARRVGWVSHDGEVLGEDLVCPRSGRRYREEAGRLVEVL